MKRTTNQKGMQKVRLILLALVLAVMISACAAGNTAIVSERTDSPVGTEQTEDFEYGKQEKPEETSQAEEPSPATEQILSGQCQVDDDHPSDLIWTLTESGTLTISGNGDMGWEWGVRDIDTAIPVRKVLLDEGVTNITRGCFADCSTLSEISLPRTLRTIEGEAFWGCTGLTSIRIPGRTEEIGYEAFKDCSNLTDVTYPDGVLLGHDAFAGTPWGMKHQIVIKVTWDSAEVPDLMVSFSGELDDGTEVDISNGDEQFFDHNFNPVAEAAGVPGDMTITLYQLDGRFTLWADNGLENGVGASEISASVTGADSGQFETDDGLYRSYTGVWFWAPFTIDHGKLTEYDASWLEEGYDNLEQAEEPVLEGDAMNSASFDDKIEAIRKVYYDTQNNLHRYEEVAAADGITYYVDGNNLKKVVVSPGAYQDEGYSDEYSAEYYYEDNRLLFVFVYYGTIEYRFYMNGAQCLRYIDNNGDVFDCLEGSQATDISEVGYFCDFAYMEPHWGGFT